MYYKGVGLVMDTKSLLFAMLFVSSAFGMYAQAPQTSPTAVKSTSTTASAVSDERSDLIEGKVVAVEDGDTFSVQTADEVIHQIRFQAVDAPENRQPYYVKSAKSLKELLLNKTIKVVVLAKDSGGRLIGTVFLDGQDVGLTQLENGMAWYYKRFAYDQTATVRKAYSDAQTKAAADRKGLWEGKNPIPPWLFRGEMFTSAPAVVTPVVTTAGQPTQTGERKYFLGPRGGCYYLSEAGAKVYVKDKNLCNVPQPENRP